MKRILFLIFFVLGTRIVLAQSFVNPDTLHQHGDIILHRTDVYYTPFAPPGPNDTRENLSNESDIYRDPNGAGDGSYSPEIYDTTHGADSLVLLANWAPSGTPIGPYTAWQRLFQAMNKPDGSHSDIIAGGDSGDYVIISKNEDVDFRATGTIKLENGFHAKPGCFFHAYQEPKWDTAVFSDEFDSAAKFHNQWFVYNGHSTQSGVSIPQCEYDSNVYLDTDYQAHDGHALDIVFRVKLDTCSCDSISEQNDCTYLNDTNIDSTHRIWRSLTETGYIRSCPLSGLIYAHTPYGKVEIRDKIPRMYHHTNEWGGPGEWDLAERWNDEDGIAHPNWGHSLRFGPCHGYFRILGDSIHDTVFISRDDSAWYSAYQPIGLPDGIIVNNIFLGIDAWQWHHKALPTDADTFTAVPGSPFPSSFATSSDTFTFYYQRWNWLTSDSTTWWVDTTGPGKDRYFHAPYHIRGGVSYLFTKDYQPHAITLRDSLSPAGKSEQKTYHCHWIASQNSPTNDGILYLDDPLDSADLKSHAEQFGYELPDAYAGAGYPVQQVLDGADTANPDPPGDSAAFVAEPYQYHTYAMEFLPHEVRILYDSVVVRRIPDRLVPPGSPYFDWVGTIGRSPLTIIPGEFDGDDSVAANSGDAVHELLYFLSHPNNPGFWDVNGQHAAHHLLDYVKVFDVPKDVIIPSYPN